MKGMLLSFCLLACMLSGCADEPAKKDEVKPEKKEEKKVMVVIETSKGTIKAELFEDKAPITVKNFLTYVDEKFYDNTIFHRVIPNFMIQGGGFTSDMVQKKTHEQIKNEAQNGLKNKRGTLAMARTMVVDSATCQFFINLVDNAFLDFRAPNPQGFGYCVFGEVKEGLEVIDTIAKVSTGNHGPHQNVPTEPVVIKSIRRAE